MLHLDKLCSPQAVASLVALLFSVTASAHHLNNKHHAKHTLQVGVTGSKDKCRMGLKDLASLLNGQTSSCKSKAINNRVAQSGVNDEVVAVADTRVEHYEYARNPKQGLHYPKHYITNMGAWYNKPAATSGHYYGEK